MSYVEGAVLGGGGGQPALSPGVPTFFAGEAAPDSDGAIRHYLSQPRKKLVYKVANRDALVSPADNFTVDADNGPVVQVHNVSPAHGEGKTWWLEFTVSTLVNESGMSGAAPLPNVILSHRWRMSHTVDTMGYCTRTIDGHCKFRSDALAKLGAYPDEYRNWLFHEPFKNSRRELTALEVSEDNNAVTYQLRDVEMASNFKFGGVGHIEVQQWVDVQTLTAEDKAALTLQAARNTAEAAAKGTAAGAAAGSSALPGTALAGALIGGTAAGLAAGAFEGAMLLYKVTPVPVVGVTVKVWGRRESTRYQLQNVALNVALARLKMSLDAVGGGAAMSLGGYATRIAHDVRGKYVELSCAIRSKWTGFKVSDWSGAISLPAAGKFFPESAEDTVLGGDQYIRSAEDIGRGPVHDGGARGSYLGLCVAQALLGQDADSPIPANPDPLREGGLPGAGPVSRRPS